MDICILSIIQKTTLKDFTTNSSKEQLYGAMTTLRNMRKRLKGLKFFPTKQSHWHQECLDIQPVRKKDALN